jgi:prophage antirepressor-like protein
MKRNAITPQLFEKYGFKIRCDLDGNGGIWFVAKDVCDCLGIEWKGSDSIGYLDDDERGVAITDTLGGKQKVITVYESGLYALIFKSRKEEAKRFRKWVTSDVLPSIRRTGSYQTPSRESVSPQDLSLIAIQKLIAETLASQAKIAALDERIKALEARLDNNGYIAPFEQKKLREAVQRRVKALRESLQERYGKEAVDNRLAYSTVWKKIGERFGLLHYGYLRSSELDKALAFVDTIEAEVCA